jgi:hypothetical protein
MPKYHYKCHGVLLQASGQGLPIVIQARAAADNCYTDAGGGLTKRLERNKMVKKYNNMIRGCLTVG